jgi:hypothetical protein
MKLYVWYPDTAKGTAGHALLLFTDGYGQCTQTDAGNDISWLPGSSSTTTEPRLVTKPKEDKNMSETLPEKVSLDWEGREPDRILDFPQWVWWRALYFITFRLLNPSSYIPGLGLLYEAFRPKLGRTGFPLFQNVEKIKLGLEVLEKMLLLLQDQTGNATNLVSCICKL